MDIFDLTPRQLKRAAVIKERIAALAHELAKLLGTSANAGPAPHVRRISAAGRRKIAAAQRARWAKLRNGEAQKSAGHASKKTAAVAKALRSANKADSPTKKPETRLKRDQPK